MSPSGSSAGPGSRALRLHAWSDGAVVAIAIAALASGFGQFGAVAALGDVAREFGRVTHGATIADQAGLSGTQLGVGLAIIRLASLGSLPLIGLADRFGRRTMLIATLSIGLALTVASAAAFGYWSFVVIFAWGVRFSAPRTPSPRWRRPSRPPRVAGRSAVALTAAGYGVGAGLIAVIHSLASSSLGFRGICALAALPLAAVPILAKRIQEPDRFTIAEVAAERPLPVLGAVGPRFRRRLLVVAALAFAISVITGPATSFVFLYAQNVLHQPGYVTAAMVVGAGLSGLIGLLAGRWLADRIGRRPTATFAMVVLSLLGRPDLRRVAGGASHRLHPRRPGRFGPRPRRGCAADRAVPDVSPGIGGGLVGGGRRSRGRDRPGGLRRGRRRGKPVRVRRRTHLSPGRGGGRTLLDGSRDPRDRTRGPLAPADLTDPVDAVTRSAATGPWDPRGVPTPP